ncbi:hypothetical protein [Streptomyces sp. HUAS TT7]|uniref:hypothetical protein n=1 Tax=Streptomyces sp. HUAS TT7 TaxID=3447507 RepID=UPI003F65B676
MRVSRVFRSPRRAAAAAALLAAMTAAITGCSGHGAPNASGASPAAAAAPAASGPSAPGTARSTAASSGVLFGGDAQLSGLTHLGRSLAIVRTYDTVDTAGAFPSAEEIGALRSGATLLASLGTGSSRDWASIAAGTSDATVLTYLRAVNAAATAHHLDSLYVSFNHEPNAKIDAGKGSPAQFVAAWRHVYQLAADTHLNARSGGHLRWVWILSANGFGHPGAADSFWPGAESVDVVGVDGYVTGSCSNKASGTYLDPAKSSTKPEAVFGPALNWGTAHAAGKPVFIPEWGSVPFTSPALRPAFIEAMTPYVAAHPQIGAVLYWNDHAAPSSAQRPPAAAWKSWSTSRSPPTTWRPSKRWRTRWRRTRKSSSCAGCSASPTTSSASPSPTRPPTKPSSSANSPAFQGYSESSPTSPSKRSGQTPKPPAHERLRLNARRPSSSWLSTSGCGCLTPHSQQLSVPGRRVRSCGL